MRRFLIFNFLLYFGISNIAGSIALLASTFVIVEGNVY
jgi:hypothetical protein